MFWIGTRLHAHSPHNVLILNSWWDTYWTAGNITGIFNDIPIEQNFNRIGHSNAQLLIDIFENLWKMEVAFLTFYFFKKPSSFFDVLVKDNHNLIMIGIFCSSWKNEHTSELNERWIVLCEKDLMVCFIHTKVISKKISPFYVFVYVETVEATLQKLYKRVKSMFDQGTCTYLPFE